MDGRRSERRKAPGDRTRLTGRLVRPTSDLLMASAAVVSPQRVRRSRRVRRRPPLGSVVRVRPQVRVRVQGLGRGRVAQPGLDGLDDSPCRISRRVVVPQIVERVAACRPPATAGRHTVENPFRRIGVPRSGVNRKPVRPAGNAARCSASASTTTLGSGTMRTRAPSWEGRTSGAGPASG